MAIYSWFAIPTHQPSVDFGFWVAGLKPKGPDSEALFLIEVTSGVVDSACHPSEVGK